MTRFDLEHIVAVLVARGVRFVDITPERTQENLARLSGALCDLGARIRSDAVVGGLAFDHDAASLDAAGVWNLTTPYGDLNLSFMPSGTGGLAQLNRDGLDVISTACGSEWRRSRTSFAASRRRTASKTSAICPSCARSSPTGIPDAGDPDN